MKDGETNYCPEINPKKYDNKKVTWKGKLFIKDKGISFFHIPLNTEAVIKRNIKKLKEANAIPKDIVILSNKKSLFHSNIYISTKKALPKSRDVKLSGTFLTRVFEGPRKNMKNWTKKMEFYVKEEKQKLKQIYYYIPSPKCAKKYGKNYAILFAEI